MKAKTRYGITGLQILAVCFAAVPPIGGGNPLEGLSPLPPSGSFRATLSLHVHTRRWDRNMTLELLRGKGGETLAHVLSPEKDAGRKTLITSKGIWSYFPGIDRILRIPRSMLSHSWLGTHLSHGDLWGGSAPAGAFEILESREIRLNGVRERETVVLARPDAAVSWSRVVLRARLPDSVPLRADFYDRKDRAVRRLTFHDPGNWNGWTIPSRVRLVPSNRPDEFTELRLLDLQPDLNLPADRFEKGRLREAMSP